MPTPPDLSTVEHGRLASNHPQMYITYRISPEDVECTDELSPTLHYSFWSCAKPAACKASRQLEPLLDFPPTPRLNWQGTAGTPMEPNFPAEFQNTLPQQFFLLHQSAERDGLEEARNDTAGPLSTTSYHFSSVTYPSSSNVVYAWSLKISLETGEVKHSSHPPVFPFRVILQFLSRLGYFSSKITNPPASSFLRILLKLDRVIARWITSSLCSNPAHFDTLRKANGAAVAM